MINLKAVVYRSKKNTIFLGFSLTAGSPWHSHIIGVRQPDQGIRCFSTSAKLLNKGNHPTPGVSVIHYNNVDVKKLDILKDNINKSGIYMFTNLINGKRYIGSTGNLSRRFSEYLNTNYLIRANYMAICNALLKHGYSNFSLDILDFCEVSDLLIKEKYYWDIFKPEYNLAKDPLAPMTGRKHTDESRKKISEAFLGKVLGENNNMYGKTHSSESRKKLSEAITGIKHHMYGKKHSDATRKKLSEARKTIKIEVFDVLKNQTTTYGSIKEAVEILKLKNAQIISNYLIRDQKKPYRGQYVFKKVNELD
jgi:group I intron endonuclease